VTGIPDTKMLFVNFAFRLCLAVLSVAVTGIPVLNKAFELCSKSFYLTPIKENW
jgi:hypothetical protein